MGRRGRDEESGHGCKIKYVQAPGNSLRNTHFASLTVARVSFVKVEVLGSSLCPNGVLRSRNLDRSRPLDSSVSGYRFVWRGEPEVLRVAVASLPQGMWSQPLQAVEEFLGSLVDAALVWFHMTLYFPVYRSNMLQGHTASRPLPDVYTCLPNAALRYLHHDRYSAHVLQLASVLIYPSIFSQAITYHWSPDYSAESRKMQLERSSFLLLALMS